MTEFRWGSHLAETLVESHRFEETQVVRRSLHNYLVTSITYSLVIYRRDPHRQQQQTKRFLLWKLGLSSESQTFDFVMFLVFKNDMMTEPPLVRLLDVRPISEDSVSIACLNFVYRSRRRCHSKSHLCRPEAGALPTKVIGVG